MTEPTARTPTASAPMADASAGRIEAFAAAWTHLLDAMEAGLAVYPPAVVDPLPAEPGPLPPALQDRAAQLLRRMAEVEAELAAQHAEVARELTGLSAARTASAATAAPNVPRFLDTRA